MRGLTEVGRVIVRCAEPVVRALADRLQEDGGVPVHGVSRAQVEDHTSTFLVDLGLALVALDEGGGEPELMKDGSEIQRLISERHGEQRARLGWVDADLRREFALLREEVERTVRAELRDGRPGGRRRGRGAGGVRAAAGRGGAGQHREPGPARRRRRAAGAGRRAGGGGMSR